MELVFFYIIIIILLITYFNYRLNDKNRDNDLPDDLVSGAYVTIAIAFFSPIITLMLYNRFNPKREDPVGLDAVGPVGDWLAGSTVPFLTFGAFLVAYATFISQKRELELTRKEYSRQSKTLDIQRFENIFFQMVGLHHEIVRSIEVSKEKTKITGGQYPNISEETYIVTTKGREYFKELCDNGLLYKFKDRDYTFYMDQFEKIYEDNEYILGHYFRNLFHIIKIIDESKELAEYDLNGNQDITKTFEHRKKYIRIIRAQLSRNELVLLLYNCLTPRGQDFYKLIVDYQLLNNLRRDILPHPLRKTFDEMKQG